MRMPRLVPVLLALGLCLIWTLSQPANAADEWMPLDPADLAVKSSSVEKDADAEAIFWQVRVADEMDGYSERTVLRHYLRIKIFTERGREAHSKIDIPYLPYEEIKDIAARTIKTDGSIVELNKADVFDRTIVKVSGSKVKAKSFAMPGIETGAIVEYRWREVRRLPIGYYMYRFSLQRDIPVRAIKYYLKPASFTSYSKIGMSAKTFHGNTTPFVKEKDGYWSTTMSNVPAFREEPRMPPEDELRAWMLVYYDNRAPQPAEQLYSEVGRNKFEEYKPMMKVTDEIKKATAEAIGDATAPEDKLHRLFDFCRAKVKNIYDDAEGLTPDQRAKMKDNKTAGDVLKRGFGTGFDIDILFAAMATAAGFESRITLLADRSQYFFSRTSTDDFQLRGYNVAVKVGEEWRFFDPASRYIPFGMLRWQEEATDTLVPDPKNPVFVKSPLSSPQKSKQTRRAKLRLGEDGTLEGDVTIEYTGHFAADLKEDLDEESEAQREDSMREDIKRRMSTAEVTAIKLENVTHPDKPLIFSYHVRVPGYAQKTGKRLFIQPAYFVHGEPAIFSTATRTYPVYFSFPWSEEDEVSIELPAGFALDSADAPIPFKAGIISEFKPVFGVTKDNKQLVAKRSFFFGGGDYILFPPTAYAQVKMLFDQLNTADNHTITLKQATTTAAAPQ